MSVQALSDRIERSVRHAEQHHDDLEWLERKVAEKQAYYSIDNIIQSKRLSTGMQIRILRGLLRLCAKEGIQLRHGTVKHCRDLIRHLEGTKTQPMRH